MPNTKVGVIVRNVPRAFGMGDVFRFNGVLWMFAAVGRPMRMGLVSMENGFPFDDRVTFDAGYQCVTMGEIVEAYGCKAKDLVLVDRVQVLEM